MKVTLIDWTGAGSSDKLYAARLLAYTKNTRLTQGEETRAKMDAMTETELMIELDYMSKTIRSSWEMVDVKFEIQGVTRAFTHQLVRTRYGVSFAQQAQRVVDMSNFETRLPETVKRFGKASVWDATMDMIAKTYQNLMAAGVPAQDARGVLPTNVLTNIIARFDLRAFADLCGKRDNPRAQDEYTDVVIAMKAEVYKIWPWAKLFCEPDRIATPALDKLMRDLLGTSGPTEKPVLNAALKELDALKMIWG